MESNRNIRVALIGNPNTGKSSVFNQLTGLRQKVGNFPGVTVDRKVGMARLQDGRELEVIDFPGTYSLYPTSLDERVVLNALSNAQDPNYPDVVVYVADVTNLERHLLLLTQVRDLGFKAVLALNMLDVAQEAGLQCNDRELAKALQLPVVPVSGRTGQGMEQLREQILQQVQSPKAAQAGLCYEMADGEIHVATQLRHQLALPSDYQAVLYAHHYKRLPFLSEAERHAIGQVVQASDFPDIKLQIRETMQRYDYLGPIVRRAVSRSELQGQTPTDRLDRVLTHRFFGPLIFAAILLLVFNAIFSWSEAPMNLIEEGFSLLNDTLKQYLPDTWWESLLTDGVLSGLSGILVFIPQIAIFFLLISLMEEVGYMARVVFMFDRLMQRFGMNGRSLVSLISGGACAIPAIMSTRTISNRKERLITILVTPLISCSARIPVYTILIAFAVPHRYLFNGLVSLQALTFLALYAMGAVVALLVGLLLNRFMRTSDSTYLMLELPEYRMPHWKNVFYNVYERVASFVTEAGKIIIIISILLWVLASFGPGDGMQQAAQQAERQATAQGLDEQQAQDLVASQRLAASYAGVFGKSIEPVIRPLGFDWKIGIALLSSFAAREVFVGTMATIYSMGSTDDEATLQELLSKQVNPDTGKPVFTVATSASLIVFYAFAMQCMSTLAVVKRETRSWKWPLFQLAYLSALAYLGSLLVYQLLS